MRYLSSTRLLCRHDTSGTALQEDTVDTVVDQGMTSRHIGNTMSDAIKQPSDRLADNANSSANITDSAVNQATLLASERSTHGLSTSEQQTADPPPPSQIIVLVAAAPFLLPCCHSC